jgi:TPR repeat protein
LQTTHWPNRKAAQQGLASAQYRLGIMYEEGDGVPLDYMYAYTWFNLAAAQNYVLAADHRDSLAKKIMPWQLSEAQQLAIARGQPTRYKVNIFPR